MKPKQLPEFDCTVAVPPLILCSIPLCLCRGGGVADIDFTHPHTFQDGPGPDHTFFSAAVALPGPSSWKMETFRVGYQLQNVFCHHFFIVFSWPRAISGISKIFWAGCPKSETPLSPVWLLLSRQSLSRSRSRHAETSGRVRLRTRRWETCLHYMSILIQIFRQLSVVHDI